MVWEKKIISIGSELIGRETEDLKDKILDEPTKQKITTVLDYKKQALDHLKEQGLESPSETEILKAAKQLYVDDKKEDELIEN